MPRTIPTPISTMQGGANNLTSVKGVTNPWHKISCSLFNSDTLGILKCVVSSDRVNRRDSTGTNCYKLKQARQCPDAIASRESEF